MTSLDEDGEELESLHTADEPVNAAVAVWERVGGPSGLNTPLPINPATHK